MTVSRELAETISLYGFFSILLYNNYCTHRFVGLGLLDLPLSEEQPALLSSPAVARTGEIVQVKRNNKVVSVCTTEHNSTMQKLKKH